MPPTLTFWSEAVFFVPLETLQGTYKAPFTLERAALFVLLGLPFTLIRHENGALVVLLGLPFTLIRHENGALFLQLGLPSTLVRHENGAFENALQIGGIWENAGFGQKLKCFENGANRKRCVWDFPQTQIQSDWYVVKCLLVWHEGKVFDAFSEWKCGFNFLNFSGVVWMVYV